MFYILTRNIIHFVLGLACALSLCISAEAARTTRSVSLSWDKGGAEAAGYRVYYGTTPGAYTNQVDVGPKNTVTLADLQPGKAYYFVVTVYDGAQVESDPSEEASVPAAVTVQLTSGTTDGYLNQNGNALLSASLAGTAAKALTVEFWVDNKKVGAATLPPYQANWPGVSTGTHQLVAVVRDADGELMRSKPLLLKVVRFVVAHIEPMQEGGVRLTVNGAPGVKNSIYYSDDLAHWTLLASVQSVDPVYWVEDPEASGATNRYYRVVAN